MLNIIAATFNDGKLKEIKQILNSINIISLKDLGFNKPLIENGKTFYENALIKAEIIHDYYKIKYQYAYVLSDDSGLEITALNGKPGVYSARYAGENSTQEMLIEKVLNEMKNIPSERREARFVCSMVLFPPERKIYHSEGFCEGKISEVPKGTNGFGYDPIFLLKEYHYNKTMAEISDQEKNKLSHRKKALDGIKKIINRQENNGK